MFTAALVILSALAITAVIAGFQMRKPSRPSIDCTNELSRRDWRYSRKPGIR